MQHIAAGQSLRPSCSATSRRMGETATRAGSQSLPTAIRAPMRSPSTSRIRLHLSCPCLILWPLLGQRKPQTQVCNVRPWVVWRDMATEPAWWRPICPTVLPLGEYRLHLAGTELQSYMTVICRQRLSGGQCLRRRRAQGCGGAGEKNRRENEGCLACHRMVIRGGAVL